MKTFTYNKNLDLRRRPYRGIIARIAKEECVSRAAIVQALQIENPRIVGIYVRYVSEAKALQEGAIAALESLAV